MGLPMPAGRYDLTIEQGATFDLTLVWLDRDKNPVDITDYTGRMHVRETVSAVTPLLTLTTENGRLILGGATGSITMRISAQDTTALDFIDGVYDLELVALNGDVFRILKGDVSLDPEITR